MPARSGDLKSDSCGFNLILHQMLVGGPPPACVELQLHLSPGAAASVPSGMLHQARLLAWPAALPSQSHGQPAAAAAVPSGAQPPCPALCSGSAVHLPPPQLHPAAAPTPANCKRIRWDQLREMSTTWLSLNLSNAKC